jgi:hypothetical protein
LDDWQCLDFVCIAWRFLGIYSVFFFFLVNWFLFLLLS